MASAYESLYSALWARAGPWRWAGAPWVRGRALAGPPGRDSLAVPSRWRRRSAPEPVGRNRAERAHAISSQQRSRTTSGRGSEASAPTSTTDELARWRSEHGGAVAVTVLSQRVPVWVIVPPTSLAGSCKQPLPCLQDNEKP